jgi:hypothetical protein
MDTTTIIIYILVATNLLSIVWLVASELRLRKILGGKRATDLETLITSLHTNVDTIAGTHDEIKRRLIRAEKRLARSVRNIKTVRFNPFADSGSNQSFATAIIDDHGDGVVLSSLYSRERVSIFAKPIEGGKPKYDLTEEEAHVLEQAYEQE